MAEKIGKQATIQDHAAFLRGGHDFQSDIQMIAGSGLITTILETVMLATNMRFAAVARVTEDRWVACRTVDEVNFGLAEGDEIEIQSTFCQSVRLTSQKVLFNDVATDEVYGNHPIAAKFGIVSYASIPIHRSDGSFFGTLCAIDTEPRDVKHPRAVAMLEMFADLIGQGLETAERLEAQEQLVANEREMARAQEEFVAVLGHDLRNPVAALYSGFRLLEREQLTSTAAEIVPMMRSTVYRMNELIDNMMIHAKARLGGGIRISRTADAPLAESITQIVEEVRAGSPDTEVHLDLSFEQPVYCDAPRVAQAVSNLLSNAVRHGAESKPVKVNGVIGRNGIEISVINQGESVPDELRKNLFDPFKRGTDTRGEGLGLGLYIASSIALAHGGQIDVSCSNGTTAFTFYAPLQKVAL
ncbi:GAF domain-containing sensor histidine kinase [Sulfitobacter mediterraneus]|uniref:GAF domain-containing sensor histidine kinase n=1 Tax=Sulfitobacter mediterraneus TaxID=83219 RepID=UPI0019399F80|nr:GAF domain-containing sensor histidine kinase [Sulfitobacter mediterraneus]MBM1558441.1 GAF domain-containing sensor histidine kinase [Sulfitobacter mediterraneus]MBM1569921.1 GAF domain-containing sensor histidine kinase [Sulfitobacter mediterraneus]MBM1573878.1 GAF domain-containing sensor histidine kinase [Sulfitobacter mediterraneus]MBM1577666.1 GAF domain-containing sensor histidine kinase [Sulfitobacter mediterraneus]MBM1581429.1 GAF domain-containing sensor histidine kinase [Sulfitob